MAADQLNPCKTETRVLVTLKRIVAFFNGVPNPRTSMPFRPLLAWMRTCRILRQPIVAPCPPILDLSVAPDVRPFLIMKQARGPVKLRQAVQPICISILR
jgi:hypothetical protein